MEMVMRGKTACFSDLIQPVLLYVSSYAWLFIVMLVGLALCSILGCLGRFHWFFELFVNFKAQYSFLAAACVAAFSLFALSEVENGRKRRFYLYWAAAGFLVVLINAIDILPVYLIHRCFLRSAPSTLSGLTAVCPERGR
jgi:hypothetical protein